MGEEKDEQLLINLFTYHVQLKNSTIGLGDVNVDDEAAEVVVFGVIGVLGVGVEGFHSNRSMDPSAFGAKYNNFFVCVGLANIPDGSSSKLMQPSPTPISSNASWMAFSLCTPPIGDGLRLGYCT